MSVDVPPPLQPGDDGYHPFLDDIGNAPGRGHFDRDGNPISMRQWGELFNREEYQRVALDYLDEGNIKVSTVWIGISVGFPFDNRPVIFETMVFVAATEEQIAERREQWQARGWSIADFPWEDLICQRYSTEEEARAGHRELVDSMTVKIELFEEAL